MSVVNSGQIEQGCQPWLPFQSMPGKDAGISEVLGSHCLKLYREFAKGKEIKQELLILMKFCCHSVEMSHKIGHLHSTRNSQVHHHHHLLDWSPIKIMYVPV